jgi:predicted phage tail protein
MPPRPPVVSSIRGGEGRITLEWTANEEQDLERYEVYRTAEPARLNSKRKMTLALAASPTGTAVAPTAAAPDATLLAAAGDQRLTWSDAGLGAGRSYYYRLVAVDLAGNASDLSDPVSGRAVDQTPPPAPLWASSDAIVQVPPPTGPLVRLSWQATPAEPTIRVQVQRQQVGGSPAWASVSDWLAQSTWDDRTAQPGASYRYRLRAMDALGNRSAWSAVRTTP